MIRIDIEILNSYTTNGLYNKIFTLSKNYKRMISFNILSNNEYYDIMDTNFISPNKICLRIMTIYNGSLIVTQNNPILKCSFCGELE